MAKKIKADKFRVSKVCETADLLVSAMDQAKKASANLSQPVIDFDDSLVDAILKHLKGVSSEEVEKAYAIAHLLKNFREKYATISTIAERLNKSEDTINLWLYKSDRLSELVKKFVGAKELSDHIATELLKFDHATQDKLVSVHSMSSISISPS